LATTTVTLGAAPVDALLTALAVLVVSCPCALGLATPLAVSAGVREALDRGIVVTDGTVFETAGEVDVIALDKTGTLTEDRMELVEVEVAGADPAGALGRAAAVERLADHPLAAAVTDAADGGNWSPPSSATTDHRPDRPAAGRESRRIRSHGNRPVTPARRIRGLIRRDDRLPVVQYLATTNPGLERAAIEEVGELVGASPRRRYRGTVSFEAGRRAAYELNYRSRTLHRVGIALVDRPFEDLADLGEAVRSLPLADHLDPDLTFGVRATRHGDHEFSSVDVGDVSGGAVVDAVRSATGEEPAVDLDDPEVIFRAFVRDDRFYFALDVTGADSLHRRHYRVCEHNSPLRPTIAAAMLRLSDYAPGDDLLDPMCGSATIPTEAALSALGDPPGKHLDGLAIERLPWFDPETMAAVRDDHARRRAALPGREALRGTVRGVDVRDRWVRCARENLAAAGVEDVVDVEGGDATERSLDADVVVSNLPFGIRTPVDLRELYGSFSERLREGSWRRAVFLTTRPEFLGLDPEEVIDVRYGRLEAAVVVADRS